MFDMAEVEREGCETIKEGKGYETLKSGVG